MDTFKTIELENLAEDLASTLLNAFNKMSAKMAGAKAKRLEDLHILANIAENVEQYRQEAFRCFETDKFQNQYQELGLILIERLFGGNGFLQRKPVIRIQLPNMPSTSFHCDSWYGHSENALSVWVPLVEKNAASTFTIAKSLSESQRLKERIVLERCNLDQINGLCMPHCRPTEIGIGLCSIFKSTTIHGAVKNDTGMTRVSFDFRLSPTEELGTKPLSNFYRVRAGKIIEGQLTRAKKFKRLKSVSYSNKCSGAAAKSQLMLCSAFAESMGIDVVLNESEIYEFEHLPVFRKYLSSSLIDAVIVFSVGVFGTDKALARSLLLEAVKNEKVIVFCSEAFMFDNSDDLEKVLGFMK